APGVQQAAAEVRQILRNLAAERLGADAGSLTIADGTISAGDRNVTYWDLVKDVQLEVEATGTAPLLPISEHKIIGQRVPRLDLTAKFIGEPRFVHEMTPEGEVFGAVARPPTYKAKLTNIDLAPVEAMPGVLKVVRNGSFLGVIAERQDQAFAAANALGAAAQWDVTSDLPGHDGIFEWLQTAEAEEKEWKNTVRSDGATPAGSHEATYYRPYQMHGSIGTSAAIAQQGDDGKI